MAVLDGGSPAVLDRTLDGRGLRLGNGLPYGAARAGVAARLGCLQRGCKVMCVCVCGYLGRRARFALRLLDVSLVAVSP